MTKKSPRSAAQTKPVLEPATNAAAGTAGSNVRQASKNTINDVARLAGVSKKTVSRVINDSPLVRPDTRDRVQALMQQIGYAPDPQARGLAFRRSFLIGLVYDNPTAQYIVNMQYGALDALRNTGFELVVHPCDSKSEGYIEGIRGFVQRQKLWGVILIPRVSEDQELAKALQELGCRYIRIASIPLDEPARMLLTHDRLAGEEVANYLESLGHRRMGLITGPKRYRSAIERGGGFIEGLARRGITLNEDYIYEGGYTFESGVAGAEKLLQRTPRPTAIFACNDEMAAGVYKAALRMGLAIPADLSVVGYDDSPLASQLWPALSTIHLPIRDLGRLAANMLLAGDPPVRGPRPAPLMAVTPHLSVRDSCQPPVE
jgi:LacI family transcriptional regulator